MTIINNDKFFEIIDICILYIQMLDKYATKNLQKNFFSNA